MAVKAWFENPQTRVDIEEKALDLIAPAPGKRRLRALLAVRRQFERMANVRALRKLVSA